MKHAEVMLEFKLDGFSKALRAVRIDERGVEYIKFLDMILYVDDVMGMDDSAHYVY